MVLGKSLCVLVYLSFVFAGQSNDCCENIHRGTLACKSLVYQLNCEQKCGKQQAMCVREECYCISPIPVKKRNEGFSMMLKPTYIVEDPVHSIEDLDFYKRLTEKHTVSKPKLTIGDVVHSVKNSEFNTRFTQKSKMLKSKYIIDDTVHSLEDSDIDYAKKPDIPYLQVKTLYALRPTVRHHIAHFCPNLDVARDCIRKCMEQGKPAFCGKDHVCYCGHKYENTGKDDSKGDTKQVYAQFKDLYAKYFGPYYEQELEVNVTSK